MGRRQWGECYKGRLVYGSPLTVAKWEVLSEVKNTMHPAKTLDLPGSLPLTSLVTYGQIPSHFSPQLFLPAGGDMGSTSGFGETLTVELMTHPTFPPSKEEVLQFKHCIREDTAQDTWIHANLSPRPNNWWQARKLTCKLGNEGPLPQIPGSLAAI